MTAAKRDQQGGGRNNVRGDGDSTVGGFRLPDICSTDAVLVLVVVAQLCAIVWVLIGSGFTGFDWLQLALVSLFMQWVTLSSAVVLCRLRGLLARMTARRAALVSYLVVPFNTWCCSVVAEFFLPRSSALPQQSFSSFAMLKGLCLNDHVLRNTLVATILGGMLFRYFYLQMQLMERGQSELKHRIQALHSRIQPHFLFNSMNSIASLISIDPETAEEVVEDLAGLFRASLHEAGNQVPLQKELDLCQRYLRIEKLRLGERLQVRWYPGNIPQSVQIPLLTLQPLVENAIVHGIQPLPEGGVVEIYTAFSHGIFEIKIVNPVGDRSEKDSDSGNRMALDNIRHRLHVLYGERAKLTSYIENQCYISHLSYPVVVNDNHQETRG